MHALMGSHAMLRPCTQLQHARFSHCISLLAKHAQRLRPSSHMVPLPLSLLVLPPTQLSARVRASVSGDPASIDSPPSGWGRQRGGPSGLQLVKQRARLASEPDHGLAKFSPAAAGWHLHLHQGAGQAPPFVDETMWVSRPWRAQKHGLLAQARASAATCHIAAAVRAPACVTVTLNWLACPQDDANRHCWETTKGLIHTCMWA